MEFAFDSRKNEVLMAKHGVTFQLVIEAIAKRGILADLANPNQDKYPGQRVLVVELEGYAYCVPYVTEGATWHLKTIDPKQKVQASAEK